MDGTGDSKHSPTRPIWRSDHSVLNGVRAIMRPTLLGDAQSIPLDCPDRERNGWTGIPLGCRGAGMQGCGVAGVPGRRGNAVGVWACNHKGTEGYGDVGVYVLNMRSVLQVFLLRYEYNVRNIINLKI